MNKMLQVKNLCYDIIDEQIMKLRSLGLTEEKAEAVIIDNFLQ